MDYNTIDLNDEFFDTISLNSGDERLAPPDLDPTDLDEAIPITELDLLAARSDIQDMDDFDELKDPEWIVAAT